jgi:hypothetical protein
MPRLIQAVPKYRKHKATGQAFVEINGRRHYLGPWQTKASKIEYDRRITEWLSSGRSSTYGVPEHVVSIVELARILHRLLCKSYSARALVGL